MCRFCNLLEKIVSLPKSLYVSVKLCQSIKDAIKVPFLVRYNCKIKSLQGFAVFKSKVKPFVFQFGFNDVGVYDKRYQRSILEIRGKLICEGNVFFGHGSRLCIMSGGEVCFGEKFQNNAMMTIICANKISFGKSVLTSWETLVMDTDFHQTINTDSLQTSIPFREIIIGDNVWIGTGVTVLKGTCIPDGCILGAKTVVVGRFKKPNTVIVGNPAREVKYNTTLKR